MAMEEVGNSHNTCTFRRDLRRRLELQRAADPNASVAEELVSQAQTPWRSDRRITQVGSLHYQIHHGDDVLIFSLCNIYVSILWSLYNGRLVYVALNIIMFH